MTEAEWNECRDAWLLFRAAAPRLSDRRARLFACACARRFWAHFDHRLCRPTVEAAERLADGLVTPADGHRAWLAMKAVAQAARRAGPGTGGPDSARYHLLAVARDIAHADIWRTIRGGPPERAVGRLRGHPGQRRRSG